MRPVSTTGTFLTRLAMTVGLSLAGCWLFGAHAVAWGLGGRSPVLNYDTAQYALAGRELADHGHLATTFALPLELPRHAAPPWPLAVVQPGLVLLEAALFRMVPIAPRIAGHQLYFMGRPDQREWLAIVVPLICYLMSAAVLARISMRLLERHAPDLPLPARVAAGCVLGLAFLLDPEAQHFATSGFTELPFTLGLVLALGALALAIAPEQPLLFGLLLGASGSFRANMLWLAPVLGVAAAALAPPPRRARVLLVVLAGYLVLAAPWWVYKWRAFGSPGWDLTRFVIWDGVGGRSWNSLYLTPDLPALPGGLEALSLIAAKVTRNLPGLLLAALTGPRALWLGALVVWLAVARGPRPLKVAAAAALAAFALGLLAAAASIPWLRYVFPARMPVEAAGLLALWGLTARIPARAEAPRLPRIVAVGAAVLALGWGALSSVRANLDAHAVAAERNLPGVATLLATGALMNREIPAGEAVMSNLGPILAWHTRRPVVHLALAPADLDACRRKLDLRHLILVYRDPDRAGPEWRDIVARPQEAMHDPALNIRRARTWRSEDGFTIVWLELGPARPRLAALAAPEERADPAQSAERLRSAATHLDAARGRAGSGARARLRHDERVGVRDRSPLLAVQHRRVLGGPLAQALDEHRHAVGEPVQRLGALSDPQDLVVGGALGGVKPASRIRVSTSATVVFARCPVARCTFSSYSVPPKSSAPKWSAIWPVFLPSLNQVAWMWSKLSR